MASLKEANGDLEQLSGIEAIKVASGGLYGDLPAELADGVDHFQESTVAVLKHHGSYQQDNRDLRKERKKQGLGKLFTMMVRTKFPGGKISAEQYLLCDDLATELGQNDIRATSRQGFQFHGVVKNNLRPLIQKLVALGNMTTLGGCGDVVRATMATPVTDIDPRYQDFEHDLIEIADMIKEKTLPKSQAFFDLWINDQKATVNPDGTVSYVENLREENVDDLYGDQYLPRKFKIAVGADFDNSTDLYTNDIGIMAVTENGRILGFEILAGGGLGYSHTLSKTYPRAASHVAFVQPDEVWPVTEAIIKVQRDYGERTDRKQARLKYTIDRLGVEGFQKLIYEYAGRTFEQPRNVKPTAQPDYLGWHRQTQDGYQYVGCWVENGRLKDFDNSFQYKTGFRAIVEKYGCDVRVTPHHNMVLGYIKDEDVDGVKAMLAEYRIPTDDIETIRRQEMACPALPLCPLAQSEAERSFPELMDQLVALGYGGEDISIRMTGCPNGCARSSSSEIGLIGKGPERYVLTVGGDYNGTRVNEILMPVIKFKDIAPTLGRLFELWKEQRNDGERFGDWSHRIGCEALLAMLEAQPAA